jgi:uncharacterized iron-regulated membrane protein
MTHVQLFAQGHAPLFGNIWLALLVILACVAVMLFGIAGFGRWLAATHPESPVTPRSPARATEAGASPEILAAIAAAVSVAVGKPARVAAVRLAPPAPAPSVETLMLQWSLEGRRQIYSSHKVR